VRAAHRVFLSDRPADISHSAFVTPSDITQVETERQTPGIPHDYAGR